MPPKGADSMAASGLHFENALVGSEWATAVLLCTNGLRKQSSYPARRPTKSLSREVIAGSDVTRGKFHARYIRLHPGKG